jgi:hypothetical protein
MQNPSIATRQSCDSIKISLMFVLYKVCWRSEKKRTLKKSLKGTFPLHFQREIHWFLLGTHFFIFSSIAAQC